MQDTFVTIARFPYSTEAQIVKGRLEADGIEVFLRDNINIDTDPLVSQAIGGVKLKVLARTLGGTKQIKIWRRQRRHHQVQDPDDVKREGRYDQTGSTCCSWILNSHL